MPSKHKVRLNPNQMSKSRRAFQEGETIQALASRMSVPFESVVKVLEMQCWGNTPHRAFSSLSAELVEEMQMLGVERHWKAERIANLYNVAHNDADFLAWLTTNSIAPPEGAQPRKKKDRGEPRKKRKPAASRTRTNVLTDPVVEIRDEEGNLLVHEGGKCFWREEHKDESLEALAARFFPSFDQPRDKRSAVIAVFVAMRRAKSRNEAIKQAKNRRKALDNGEIGAFIDWLKGRS